MNRRELIDEHTAFLGVYQARISRAQQVLEHYNELRAPILKQKEKLYQQLVDLEQEYVNAEDVIDEYETLLNNTRRLISELERNRSITRDRKKPGRLNQLLRLQRKLTRMLEEDPELVEYLDAMEEEDQ